MYCLTDVLFTGDKNIALFIGGIIALFTLLKYGKLDKSKLTSFVQQALMSGGGIILITASGGAFGGMLQQTGISQRIAVLSADFQLGLIPLAFLITMIVRSAQGSATVALITASGILAGMAQHDQFELSSCLPLPGHWKWCKTHSMDE